MSSNIKLRAQARAEEESKRAAGAGPSANSEKVGGQSTGWAAPAECERIQCTELESELREAVQGPDPAWLADYRANTNGVTGTGESQAPGAAEQQRWLDEVQASGELAPLTSASDYLRAHALARLAHARSAGATLTLAQLLLEATRDWFAKPGKPSTGWAPRQAASERPPT